MRMMISAKFKKEKKKEQENIHDHNVITLSSTVMTDLDFKFFKMFSHYYLIS